MRGVRDAQLIPLIRKAHTDNVCVYGARKIWGELSRTGVPVARCTVAPLMRAEGLRGIARENPPDNDQRESRDRAAGRPGRATVLASAPNQLWFADITCIRTDTGRGYAALVLDVFSRYVVGWQVSTSTPRTKSTLAAARPMSASRPTERKTGSTGHRCSPDGTLRANPHVLAKGRPIVTG